MLSIFIIFSLLFQAARGFIITVDAHDTACFYDRVHNKDKVTMRFEVMEGGFKDIGLHITGPDNETLFQSDKETSGSYTFAASQDGEYKLCLDNERSTLTPKVLMFHFTVIKDLSYYNDPEKRTDDVIEQSVLQESVNTLAGKLMAIKNEQEYMHVRYSGHLEIAASVHFRTMAWSIFGPSLLLLLTILEIYYLKRFFEVKRVV